MNGIPRSEINWGNIFGQQSNPAEEVKPAPAEEVKPVQSHKQP